MSRKMRLVIELPDWEATILRHIADHLKVPRVQVVRAALRWYGVGTAWCPGEEDSRSELRDVLKELDKGLKKRRSKA